MVEEPFESGTKREKHEWPRMKIGDEVVHRPQTFPDGL